MRRAAVVVSLGIALMACEVDVRVGATPLDAAVTVRDASVVDAGVVVDAGGFDAGVIDGGAPDAGSMNAGTARVWMISATPNVMCTDGFAGREADFMDVAPNVVGINGGTIDLTYDDTMATMSGDAVQQTFGTGRLVLRTDVVPKQPAGVFIGGVGRNESGPLGTQLVSKLVYVDTNQPNLVGEVGAELQAIGGDGSCFVSYPHSLSRP